jgi:hypothetical protein
MAREDIGMILRPATRTKHHYRQGGAELPRNKMATTHFINNRANGLFGHYIVM